MNLDSVWTGKNEFGQHQVMECKRKKGIWMSKDPKMAKHSIGNWRGQKNSMQKPPTRECP